MARLNDRTMAILQQILFIAVLGVVAWLAYRRINLIRSTILLGKPEDRSDRLGERLSMMLRIAFGQKKMFDRPLIGVLHFAVYIGFILINVDISHHRWVGRVIPRGDEVMKLVVKTASCRADA